MLHFLLLALVLPWSWCCVTGQRTCAATEATTPFCPYSFIMTVSQRTSLAGAMSHRPSYPCPWSNTTKHLRRAFVRRWVASTRLLHQPLQREIVSCLRTLASGPDPASIRFDLGISSVVRSPLRWSDQVIEVVTDGFAGFDRFDVPVEVQGYKARTWTQVGRLCDFAVKPIPR